ncbi:helix-turn-helix domain-containing protein [Pelagicoccus sp. NFK12]|uniref:Helix-turn-helix domain-containing protein n=1 Tax=Pelagicoccus enzymogenes TaxID=2773457 RepID=A0A927IJ35_9BACT|nr:helix-turn-helix domain-containing protein [Pelagicoccus enzymogenes]MBD5781906.1 helix-turn-helix domain-containing protein [Pelagicoccus enzymogenes]
MPLAHDKAAYFDNLIAKLQATDDYQEYESAFRDATGLPLTLEPASRLTLALCSKHQSRTSFCSLMNQAGHSCKTCQALHRGIEKEMGIEKSDSHEQSAAAGTTFTEKSPQSVDAVNTAFGDAPRTFECFAGLCETMVPVKAGKQLFAFLKTGQVMVKEPTRDAFRSAMGKLERKLSDQEVKTLEKAYFATPIVPPAKYRAMTTLLKTYARQLSLASQRILTELDNQEPNSIRKAKAYLAKNYRNPLTLSEVANAAGISPFHFSKRFKETVGIGFAEYLSRLRVQECKKLLWNPNLSITEAAFECGFQSMASFSRAWNRLEEQSPKQYRKSLTPQ